MLRHPLVPFVGKRNGQDTVYKQAAAGCLGDAQLIVILTDKETYLTASVSRCI